MILILVHSISQLWHTVHPARQAMSWCAVRCMSHLCNPANCTDANCHDWTPFKSVSLLWCAARQSGWGPKGGCTPWARPPPATLAPAHPPCCCMCPCAVLPALTASTGWSVCLPEAVQCIGNMGIVILTYKFEQQTCLLKLQA